MRMLCIPLGHAGALGSAQWLIRPSRVYSPGENILLFTFLGEASSGQNREENSAAAKEREENETLFVK